MVEEKGIYSIEKFLVARRLMYWQVYLHKTVVAAEQMLVRVLKRAKELAQQGVELDVSDSLRYCLYELDSDKKWNQNASDVLNNFARLDDYDIFAALKTFTQVQDPVLALLSKALIDRKLFKIELGSIPFKSDYIDSIRSKVLETFPISKKRVDHLIITGKETNSAYNTSKEEIKILYKGGKILPMSEISDFGIKTEIITKYYLCYPKNIPYF